MQYNPWCWVSHDSNRLKTFNVQDPMITPNEFLYMLHKLQARNFLKALPPIDKVHPSIISPLFFYGGKLWPFRLCLKISRFLTGWLPLITKVFVEQPRLHQVCSKYLQKKPSYISHSSHNSSTAGGILHISSFIWPWKRHCQALFSHQNSYSFCMWYASTFFNWW